MLEPPGDAVGVPQHVLVVLLVRQRPAKFPDVLPARAEVFAYRVRGRLPAVASEHVRDAVEQVVPPARIREHPRELDEPAI